MKWSLDRVSAIKFGATIAISLGIAILSYTSLRQLQRTSKQVKHTQQLLDQLEVVLSQLKDTETGQRGYLLTGQRSYLQPYQAARSTLDREFNLLTQLVDRNPVQQQRVAAIKQLTAKKLAITQRSIELRQIYGYEAAIQLIETQQDKQLMDQIRAIATALKQEAQEALDQKTQLERSKSNLATALIIGGIVLEVLLTTGIVWQLNQEVLKVQQSQETLRRRERRYRSLVTATSQVVWLANVDGNLTSITPSWYDITGQTEQDIHEGRGIEAVYADDRAQVQHQWRTAVMTEQLFEAECRLYTATHHLRNFLLRAVPVAAPNGVLEEWVGVCIDITERKQAELLLRNSRDELEKEIQQRTRQLTRANAALKAEMLERLEVAHQLEQLAIDLQRSNQELEQFAYVASHDLQEPLRAVANYTQLLAEKYRQQLDDKADKYIRYIVDGATRMQQLISDLLTYSRVGRQQLILQPVDCNLILIQVLENLQSAIEDSQAVITYDALPTLTADPIRLIQLIQNLISNAIKYRGEHPPSIHVSAKPQPDAWLFSVQDQGIGIDPQYADRIFVIFQRLHTRCHYPGTGIGLSICKKIVEMHQGQIWVDSQMGQGATFYFTLPVINQLDSIPLLQETCR
jgi:PAS domain S-box-containing protein